MAVGMLIALPGVTQEQYEQVNTKIFGQSPFKPEDAPQGLIVHSAGPVPDGWYVYDIWESKEDFQRFAEEKLGPATQEVAGGAFGGEPQFFEISSLVLTK
jgi:hypothetical protein